MLNINNLKTTNKPSTSSNVVDFISQGTISINQDKINYAFNILAKENPSINKFDYMLMNDNLDFCTSEKWSFKNKYTKDYIHVSKIVEAPSLIEASRNEDRVHDMLSANTLDRMPESVSREMIFTPEVFKTSSGGFASSENSSHVLARNIDRESPFFGEFTDKIGGSLSNDYNFISIPEKVQMFNSQIANKFGHMLPNDNSLSVRQTTAYNGGYYRASYRFNDINAKVQIGDNGKEYTLYLDIQYSTGLGGLATNKVFYKTYDSYCSNGQIFFGKTCVAKMKHTKNSNIEFYLDNSTDEIEAGFKKNVALMQSLADLKVSKSLGLKAIELFTKKTFKDLDDRKRQTRTLSHSLTEQLEREFDERGCNAFALNSVFTAYASHTEGKAVVDGFGTRETKTDHLAHTLEQRQETVSNFLSGDAYNNLLETARAVA